MLVYPHKRDTSRPLIARTSSCRCETDHVVMTSSDVKSTLLHEVSYVVVVVALRMEEKKVLMVVEVFETSKLNQPQLIMGQGRKGPRSGSLRSSKKAVLRRYWLETVKQLKMQR